MREDADRVERTNVPSSQPIDRPDPFTDEKVKKLEENLRPLQSVTTVTRREII